VNTDNICFELFLALLPSLSGIAETRVMDFVRSFLKRSFSKRSRSYSQGWSSNPLAILSSQYFDSSSETDDLSIPMRENVSGDITENIFLTCRSEIAFYLFFSIIVIFVSRGFTKVSVRQSGFRWSIFNARVTRSNRFIQLSTFALIYGNMNQRQA